MNNIFLTRFFLVLLLFLLTKINTHYPYCCYYYKFQESRKNILLKVFMKATDMLCNLLEYEPSRYYDSKIRIF